MKILLILYLLAIIAATMAGLTETLGLNIFLAAILGTVLSMIPFGGTVAAIWGAISAWGMELPLAILIYVLPPIIIFIIHSLIINNSNSGKH